MKKYCKDYQENELKEILDFREKIFNILEIEFYCHGFTSSNKLLKILNFIDDEIMNYKNYLMKYTIKKNQLSKGD